MTILALQNCLKHIYIYIYIYIYAPSLLYKGIVNFVHCAIYSSLPPSSRTGICSLLSALRHYMNLTISILILWKTAVVKMVPLVISRMQLHFAPGFSMCEPSFSSLAGEIYDGSTAENLTLVNRLVSVGLLHNSSIH